MPKEQICRKYVLTETGLWPRNCNENPEIDLCKAKLLCLQSYMNDISKSNVSVLSESDSASVNPDQTKNSIPIKKGEKDIENKGQQIPVVVTDRSQSYTCCITVLEKQTTMNNSCNVSDKRQQTHPTTSEKSTYVIGTSLIHGLCSQLHQIGTQATCYTHPGCLIPDIRGRTVGCSRQIWRSLQIWRSSPN